MKKTKHHLKYWKYTLSFNTDSTNGKYFLIVNINYNTTNCSNDSIRIKINKTEYDLLTKNNGHHINYLTPSKKKHLFGYAVKTLKEKNITQTKKEWAKNFLERNFAAKTVRTIIKKYFLLTNELKRYGQKFNALSFMYTFDELDIQDKFYKLSFINNFKLGMNWIKTNLEELTPYLKENLFARQMVLTFLFNFNRFGSYYKLSKWKWIYDTTPNFWIGRIPYYGETKRKSNKIFGSRITHKQKMETEKCLRLFNNKPVLLPGQCGSRLASSFKNIIPIFKINYKTSDGFTPEGYITFEQFIFSSFKDRSKEYFCKLINNNLREFIKYLNYRDKDEIYMNSMHSKIRREKITEVVNYVEQLITSKEIHLTWKKEKQFRIAYDVFHINKF